MGNPKDSILINVSGGRTVVLENPVASVVALSDSKRSAMVIITGTVYGKNVSATRHMRVDRGTLTESALPDGSFRRWMQKESRGALTLVETVKPKPRVVAMAPSPIIGLGLDDDLDDLDLDPLRRESEDAFAAL